MTFAQVLSSSHGGVFGRVFDSTITLNMVGVTSSGIYCLQPDGTRKTWGGEVVNYLEGTSRMDALPSLSTRSVTWHLNVWGDEETVGGRMRGSKDRSETRRAVRKYCGGTRDIRGSFLESSPLAADIEITIARLLMLPGAMVALDHQMVPKGYRFESCGGHFHFAPGFHQQRVRCFKARIDDRCTLILHVLMDLTWLPSNRNTLSCL